MNEIQLHEDENPLELLGIEPWALKSIPKDRRPQFLRDASKFLARYHHPDLYREEADKKKHSAYLARLNDVVDRLAGDRFALEEALSEFNTVPSKNIGAKVNLNKLQERSATLEQQNKQLQAQITRAEQEYHRGLEAALVDAAELRGKLEVEKINYESILGRNADLRGQLDKFRQDRDPAMQENARLLRRINFLKSEKGPYRKALSKLQELRDTLTRRHNYEADALAKLPFLHQDLVGTIGIRTYTWTAITNQEYGEARHAAEPVAALRKLFLTNASEPTEQVQVGENQTINLEGRAWKIMGLVPYNLIVGAEKNLLHVVNRKRNYRWVMNEFEYAMLPHTIPFIGTAARGLTLVRAAEDSTSRAFYRLIATVDYNLQYARESKRKMKDSVKIPERKFQIVPYVAPENRLPWAHLRPATQEPKREVREIDIDRGD